MHCLIPGSGVHINTIEHVTEVVPGCQPRKSRAGGGRGLRGQGRRSILGGLADQFRRSGSSAGGREGRRDWGLGNGD